MDTQTNTLRQIIETPFSTKSILSYGLIVYAKREKRWLIVQRKHSVEFILYMKGLYRLSYLPEILKNITQEEKEIIYLCLEKGPIFYEKTYSELDLDIKNFSYALIRMSENKENTKNILDKCDVSKNTLTWTWPKGRLSHEYLESPYDCALREFKEEVEIDLPPPIFLYKRPLISKFSSYMERLIEQRCWLYVISETIPLPIPDNHPEVLNRDWVDFDTCKQRLKDDKILSEALSIVDYC